MVLPCEHSEGCMYRYRHKGITRKYCMACIVEKHPEAEITPTSCAEYAKKQLAKQKEIHAKLSGVEKPTKVKKVEKKDNSSDNKPK